MATAPASPTKRKALLSPPRSPTTHLDLPVSPKKARTYADAANRPDNAKFVFRAPATLFTPTPSQSTLAGLKRLAIMLRAATPTSLSPEELAAATEVAQLATALTAAAASAPASKRSASPNTDLARVTPALPAAPSFATHQIKKPRRKARPRPARRPHFAAAAQRTIIIAFNSDDSGRDLNIPRLLRSLDGLIDGSRTTRKGNVAVIARRSTHLPLLHAKILEKCSPHAGVHVFLDGAWEDIVIHGVRYDFCQYEEDVVGAIADFAAQCPGNHTPMVQRVLPLMSASERKTYANPDVPMRVLIAGPGFGDVLIREGIAVGGQFCRVSRYRPRKPSTTPLSPPMPSTHH
jgi:hypothetical protein